MNLISSEYLAQQTILHENPDYGVASIQYAPLILDLFNKIDARSISDYGAGKKKLYGALKIIGLEKFDYFPYDPVFPEYGAPKTADLVCCIDVLEHIELEFIDNVIKELSQITLNFGIFTIATGPAMKTLNDGRNAHLIQQPSSWWLTKLIRYFEIVELRSNTDRSFWVIVKPKKIDQTQFL